MIDSATISKKLQKVDLSKTSNFLKGFFQPEEIRAAAVIMPLVCRADGWHILFIRRTSHDNDMHSGQVAFPGGKHEEFDVDFKATALREFAEETGIDTNNLEIIGQLPNMTTVTKFCITPYIAFLSPEYVPDPDPTEVARMFEIPLTWLMDEDNINRHERDIFGEMVDVIVYEEFDGETLWGASARLTEYLLQALDLA